MMLFADLQRQLNRLFEQTAALHRTAMQAPGWLPKVDVIDFPDRTVVSVEVPGVAPESIELSVSGEILTLRGTKRADLPPGVQGQFRCVERERGNFRRTIHLGRAVDPGHCRAGLADGLLTIEFEKRNERRDRTYNIPIDLENSQDE